MNKAINIKSFIQDEIRGAVKKFPELFYIDSLVPYEFIPPGQCYWSFKPSSLAEEAVRQVAGRDSDFCVTIRHQATHRLLRHHPTTVLSGSPSQWLLAVPYSEDGPQGDMEGIEPNATAELWKKEGSSGASNSGRIDWAGVCVCMQGSSFGGDYVSVAVCPTITVQ
jgi:hypothetical protein